LLVFIFSNNIDLLSRLGYVLDDLMIGIRYLAVAESSLRHRVRTDSSSLLFNGYRLISRG